MSYKIPSLGYIMYWRQTQAACGCVHGSDEPWYGMVWYRMVWYGMVWYGMVWYGMVWYGMVWYGMVWYGMVWYGMVWYDMVCTYGMVRSIKPYTVASTAGARWLGLVKGDGGGLGGATTGTCGTMPVRCSCGPQSSGEARRVCPAYMAVISVASLNSGCTISFFSPQHTPLHHW